MSDRNLAEKLSRAAHSAARGERFRQFVDDPDITAFLDAFDKDRIREMVQCKPSDDEGRRDAALRLWAMQQLRQFIASAISAGQQAERVLARESNTDGR